MDTRGRNTRHTGQRTDSYGVSCNIWVVYLSINCTYIIKCKHITAGFPKQFLINWRKCKKCCNHPHSIWHISLQLASVLLKFQPEIYLHYMPESMSVWFYYLYLFTQQQLFTKIWYCFSLEDIHKFELNQHTNPQYNKTKYMYYITAHFCICAKVYDNINVAVNTLIIAKCSYFKFNNLYV